MHVVVSVGGGEKGRSDLDCLQVFFLRGGIIVVPYRLFSPSSYTQNELLNKTDRLKNSFF